jgi:uncharacterized membrane protein
MTKKINLKRITRTPIWIAVGVAFFSFFLHGMGNPKIGQMFLPMHFVALLAGLVDGPAIGFMTGLLMPVLSTLISGLPPYPMFLFMMAEIGLYGFFSGLLRKTNVFFNLLISILIGRIGICYFLLCFRQCAIDKNDSCIKPSSVISCRFTGNCNSTYFYSVDLL